MQQGGSAAASVALVCGDSTWEHAYAWLLESAGFAIAARARDVDRAPDVVVRATPDVLVVDVDDAEPARILRRLREVHRIRPSTHVVAVCDAADAPAHDAALAGGARVAVRTNALDLLHALRCADGDGCDCDGRPQLTLREFEILRLVAEGRTNREAARAAWVSEQTVKYHLANIYRRLGVHGRAEALAWAEENGVVGQSRGAGRSTSSA